MTDAAPAEFIEKRRGSRVKLTVPVQLRCAVADSAGASSLPGHSQDVSPSGVYVRTETIDAIRPGDVVMISLVIPWEARGQVPFSHIVGAARVIRIEEPSRAAGLKGYGVALGFCEDRLTMLGAT